VESGKVETLEDIIAELRVTKTHVENGVLKMVDEPAFLGSLISRLEKVRGA
jgi:hypothetical protein